MNNRIYGRLTTLCSTLLLTLVVGRALADDTEIFFNRGVNGANANVLLVLDTSGSMTDVVSTQFDFDPAHTYHATKCIGGDFSSSYVYYSAVNTVPKCGSTSRFQTSVLRCAAATTALSGVSGTPAVGFYSDSSFIQWGSKTTKKKKVTTTTYQWQGSLGVSNGADVECQADAGIHGPSTGDSKKWPSKDADASSTVGKWDTNSANSWWTQAGNAGGAYVLYSANYMNYFYDGAASSTETKVSVLQQAATTLLNAVTNVNVGLMRYDSNGSGGMMQNAVGPIATNKASILTNVNKNAPSGNTPISETLFEAYRYMSGGAVNFGNASKAALCNTWTTVGGLKTCTSSTTSNYPSVAASRTPAVVTSANYASPAQLSCQKNFVVFLTDGLPNGDTSANSLITGLPNFSTAAGSCYASASAMYSSFGLTQPTGTDGTGLCSAALAKYMNQADMNKNIGGVQNLTTFMIGFGNDFSDSSGTPTAAFKYLNDIAAKGGGKGYTATSLSELTTAFTEIFNAVKDTNTTFTAPAVAVNAFNRTQSLNDLYVSVFSPTIEKHWPGNMKHYKVVGGEVVGVGNVPAINPSTGFFKAEAQDLWSPTVDGFEVEKGGAANLLPDPSVRKIYTYVGDNPVGSGAGVPLNVAASNATLLVSANALLTDAVLNIGQSGDPSRTTLIDWARGLDVPDTTTRHEMGDPVHTAPAVVIYGMGATVGAPDDTVAYVPTNDGYLHAVRASTGVEMWSFVPQEMLGSLAALYDNPDVTSKHYGLDGPITVLKYDVNGDGTITSSAGDKVVLFFGTGRSELASTYYALDVTTYSSPVLLWAIDSSDLPNLGKAWSQPMLTRVRVSGATQNSQRLALVIGGGYDPVEDSTAYLDFTASGSRQPGANLFIVDALYGTLLWDARSNAPFNQTGSRMDHSMPGNVAVMDIDSDGYADRLYAGDTSGQLWRFDITNNNTASTLVAGGVIASLGTREDATHRAVATRRFYSTPDVALIRTPGRKPYVNIGIGSGWRGHPLDQVVRDRFYAVRDLNTPLGSLSQTAFNTITSTGLIRDAEATSAPAANRLTDISDLLTPVIPAGSPGWQLVLDRAGANTGEKSLSPSSTFNNTIIFTTYSPTITAAVSGDECAGVGSGTNRAYVVNVADGSPAVDQDEDGMVELTDRSADLAQTGIAPQAQFLFLPTDTDVNNPNPDLGASNVTCLSGVEVLGICGSFNQRVKTYWREGQAN